MRLFKEIPHSEYKISIYKANAKYILKYELGNFEQIYKIPEHDILEGEASLDNLVINEAFLLKLEDIFKMMQEEFYKVMEA